MAEASLVLASGLLEGSIKRLLSLLSSYSCWAQLPGAR